MTQGGQPVQDLEDQGGFPDPGITADQDSRSWNHPAPEHPVQFIDPDQVPLLPLIGNFFQRLGERLPDGASPPRDGPSAVWKMILREDCSRFRNPDNVPAI